MFFIGVFFRPNFNNRIIKYYPVTAIIDGEVTAKLTSLWYTWGSRRSLRFDPTKYVKNWSVEISHSYLTNTIIQVVIKWQLFDPNLLKPNRTVFSSTYLKLHREMLTCWLFRIWNTNVAINRVIFYFLIQICFTLPYITDISTSLIRISEFPCISNQRQPQIPDSSSRNFRKN